MTQFWADLRCPVCAWQQAVDQNSAKSWLNQAGMSRAGKPPPDVSILRALLEAAKPRLTCPSCGHQGLAFIEAPEDEEDQWPSAVLCRRCQQPIPQERLEAVPEAQLCLACQTGSEEKTSDFQQFCPRCQRPLQWKVANEPAQTKYLLVCPDWKTCHKLPKP